MCHYFTQLWKLESAKTLKVLDGKEVAQTHKNVNV